MDYRKAAEACTHGEAPACAAACVFHLDIRQLLARVRARRFDAAYNLFRDATVFPGIVSRLCPGTCGTVCERNVCDAAVDLPGLERAILHYAKKKEALRLNVPSKGRQVAVVGAGPGGLACALRLGTRGYAVTVYEKTGRLGGSLWSRFPEGGFAEEIETQFKYARCAFELSAEIRSLGDIAFDAAYVAAGPGKAAADFGGPAEGVLFSESIPGAEDIFSLAAGIEASNRIEAYLKTGHMPLVPTRGQAAAGTGVRGPADRPVNRPDPASLVPAPPVRPAGGIYTAEEAAEEAARCHQCDCTRCADRCPLIRHYRRFPPHIAAEVEGTVRPTDPTVNRLNTRMVAACDQCGQCAEVCPQGVDLRALFTDAKHRMKEAGAMPAAFSAFWLADMAHAEENAFVCGPERPGAGSSGRRYAFFPGCRLGAADPRYVTETYKRLLENDPGTALAALCCGAPAFWAGDMALYAKKQAGLRKTFASLGFPTPVCACPTCALMLKRAMPEIEVRSLYALDLGRAAREKGGDGEARTVSVFDPCASRFDRQAQEGVRNLLLEAGFGLRPLAFERENTLCCGWGGQSMIANPPVAAQAAERCAALAETAYVTYCVNCRDTLAAAGKPVWHILDILLGINGPDKKPPTHTKRRENREILLREMRGQAVPDDQATRDAPPMPDDQAAREARFMRTAQLARGGRHEQDTRLLYMDESLREKLSNDWILEQDVLAAILRCETEKRKVRIGETGAFAGHSQSGGRTHWVEYRPEGEGYRLLNAYAHKLTVDGE